MDYFEQLKDWFETKITINNKNVDENYRYKKWDVWYINFWVNIWNEFNKIRPAVILTTKKYSKWNNLIVVPISSFSLDKKILNTNIVIKEDFLKQKSIIKLNHLRDISKKRLIKKIWRLWDKYLKELDKSIKDLFDIRE